MIAGNESLSMSLKNKFIKKPNFRINKTRIRSERIRLKRQLIDSLGGKCVDCGYSAHLAALDFDHVDPKTKTKGIGQMLPADSIEYILVEASKCVIRCANCHRIKTHPNATD